jgi:ATP-binding cassette subfamily B (MDR/TAP) protein 1
LWAQGKRSFELIRKRLAILAAMANHSPDLLFFSACSGGGKSTTVSLIERFYDPTTGSVELDGTNLRDINVHHLRSLIGYVGQEPTLFATTIAGNIQYGKPGATQEEIEAAAKMANAHDFISSFPDGYLTQVGDKGAQLSGGKYVYINF